MLTKRPGSPYWQIEFQLFGISIRRSSGTSSRKEAQKLEQKWRQDLWDSQKLDKAQPKTWDEGVEEYLRLKQSKKSLKRDKEVFAMAGLRLAGKPIADITEADIRSYGVTVAAATSEANANRHLAYIRALLNTFKKWKYLDKVPDIELYSPPKFEPTVISKEQYAKLLTCLLPYQVPLIVFGVETGLRWANIARLRWAPTKPGEPFEPYVEKDGSYLHVPPNMAKAGKPITIPLSTAAWDLIRDMERSKSGYVFITAEGEPIKHPLSRSWKRACRLAGLPTLRFHDLRHAWCSWHIQDGTPSRVVQELGGWSTDSMVKRYSHLNVDHLRQYVK